MSSSEFKSGEMPFYVDPMFDESFGKTAIFTDSPIPVKFLMTLPLCSGMPANSSLNAAPLN